MPSWEEQKQLKHFLKYILTFILLVTVCTLALVSVAMIPRSSIQQNMEESAEYLNAHKDHFKHYLIDGIESSIVDEVADANLLNVAYFWNADHPLESVMRSECYMTLQDQNKMFLEAVKSEVEPNMQYYRYWHGSLLFVRPLLLVLNIHQIYILHYFVIASLFCCLLTILFRHGFKAEGISLIVSMISVSLWVVPFCLEFTWMFLLTFAVSILCVKLASMEKYDSFGWIFFVTGMITIFLDFFTTETLTLLIPLLLTLRVQTCQGKDKRWIFMIRCCAMWGIGYVLMWVTKWGLASCILKFNAFREVTSNIDGHLANAGYVSRMSYWISILVRNIWCMFPLSYGMAGSIFGASVILFGVFLPVLFDRIRLKEKIRLYNIGIYAVLGIVPYIRFITISHHSWYHYSFTYRAQAASVLALCFIILELVQLNPRKAVIKNA